MVVMIGPLCECMYRGWCRWNKTREKNKEINYVSVWG